MNTFLKTLATSAIIAGAAPAAFAETDMGADPMTMTCADYSALDDAGKMAATQQIDAMVAMTPEEQTAAAAMTPEEKAAAKTEADAAMAAMTDEQKTAADEATKASMAKLVEACTATPDSTVMDAAKAGM
jgi:hypothetical protein